ncbi:MAG: transcription termination factor Rho [Armatimonadetes bacterium]|nr:transcription termination factor Rho [Armatimonadota bacterium]PIU95244.1 MAG: transcription termination factor Rho [Armatimonadetes bacterium CG06_land_8_20_14_3_00_66_21]PIX45226.1 MAG: transcription termination factor Rho [Armatimonadetes bacterium CG_4_8_14_3_um_filter_66_20]PJB74049.1 MAG: transcription termination factor Rho [Armatimonadetes bacterium CG_4_9_14_3_um_filter_66_14]NCP31734.1 transcription termination factor Rho [Armatimonadota bacterium]
MMSLRDYELDVLEQKTLSELQEVAKSLDVQGTAKKKKSDLARMIREEAMKQSGILMRDGIVEVLPDGYAFMRIDGYLPNPEDVYVSQSQIKRFGLRTGDSVMGQVRAPKNSERYYSLLRIERVNGKDPDAARERPHFEDLIPIFPNEKFELETGVNDLSARLIDLVSPIGKGQRGLIVAPPKAGKTVLLKTIANNIKANHPEVVLLVLLIDERPEEVTDIERSVDGEVIASTFDQLPENHMRVSEMTLDRAKRLLETGYDVVILLDSITRLSRASNLTVNPSGRTLSGGLDPAAMYRPKRFFGAARNIEGGGSLTIVATALVDTGSRMDDHIFEEFKGTGNLDLVLNRDLFDRRIFPAIDVKLSSTRHEELLRDESALTHVWQMRRMLTTLETAEATELLLDRLRNTKNNKEFLALIQKSFKTLAKGS